MRAAIRTLCVVIGFGLVAWTAIDLVLGHKAYAGWLDENASRLGGAQRDIARYERRLDARHYRKLPAKIERADAEAAELAEPVMARLEGERLELFRKKKAAERRFRIGLIVSVLLLVIARGLTQANVARWR